MAAVLNVEIRALRLATAAWEASVGVPRDRLIDATEKPAPVPSAATPRPRALHPRIVRVGRVFEGREIGRTRSRCGLGGAPTVSCDRAGSGPSSGALLGSTYVSTSLVPKGREKIRLKASCAAPREATRGGASARSSRATTRGP